MTRSCSTGLPPLKGEFPLKLEPTGTLRIKLLLPLVSIPLAARNRRMYGLSIFRWLKFINRIRRDTSGIQLALTLGLCKLGASADIRFIVH